MKRGIVAAIVIALLIIGSTFLLAPPLMPDTQSVEARSETNPVSTHVGPSSAANAVDDQAHANRSILQSSEASLLGAEQSEQTLTQDQSTAGIQTDQNQTAQPPAPFPDGRIFLSATGEADGAIPYIPTEYPKPTTIPIIPSESDI